MALPTILVNSATGSDSAASGAGPGTAITGSTGRTRNTASQLRFGLFGATDDLSGVATDGSAALYMAISTAGQRNFSAVSGTKNTRHTTTGNMTSGAAILSALASTTGWAAGDVVKVAGAGAASADLYSTILTVDSGTQVTLNDNAGTTVVGAAVENPKQFSLATGQGVNTGATDTAWAIGGKRASIGSTTSKKLFDNNSAAGDAMPGWTVRMESGHAETITATFDCRRAGTVTDGPVVLEGEEGAATMPILTFNNNGNAIVMRGDYQQYRNFEMRNTAAKTASTAFITGSAGSYNQIINITCEHSTNYFWRFLNDAQGAIRVFGCRIGYCVASAAVLGSSLADVICGCVFHHCTSHAIEKTAAPSAHTIIQNNLFYANGGDGIRDSSTGGSSAGGLYIDGNTFHDHASGNGVNLTATPNVRVPGNLTIKNNIFTSVLYAIAFEGTYTNAYLLASGVIVWNNNYHTVTSGFCNISLTGIEKNTQNLGPSYVNAAAGNFTVTNESLKATGYPTAIGSVPNYVTPGALQVQSPTPAEIAEAVWEYPDRQLTA